MRKRKNLFRHHERLRGKISVLTSIMEAGQLSLEEWGFMLQEMGDTYVEMSRINKEILN